MNRKILFITILVASFFFVSLGMRIPSLIEGSAPKPRPRAVIENAIQKVQSVVKQFKVESADLHGLSCAAPGQRITLLAKSPELYVLSFIPSVLLPARAPPCPFTCCS